VKQTVDGVQQDMRAEGDVDAAHDDLTVTDQPAAPAGPQAQEPPVPER
jgi:hypothetical protein